MLIESFHFGHPGHRRYGSLHRPTTRLVRETGVLLCPPLGHEYFRSYRAYVKWAETLSHAGFPVLRFDYFGTGDSEGDGSTMSLDGCIDDIVDAVDELRRSENVRAIALGGMRSGALLATRAADRLQDAEALLLWNPALDGAAFVAELRELHSAMLGDLERFATTRDQDETDPSELVGVPFGRFLLRELELCKQVVPSSLKTIVAMPSDDAGASSSIGADVEVVESLACGWNDRRRIEEIIVDPATSKLLTQKLGAAVA